MALFSLVMVGLLVILGDAITTSLADQALPQSKSGCSENCGNVTIPYPFGIGEGCYLRPEFNINCAQSYGQPPIAYLGKGNLIVTNISLYGEVHILNWVARDCYNKQGNQTDNFKPWLSLEPPYSLSSTKNKFVVVGCDTYAYYIGYRDNQKYTTICMSLCDNLGTAREEDSCSGIGCCQNTIPSGLKNQTVELRSFYNHTAIWDFNPCSYAFLVEEGKSQFNGTSFLTINERSRLPAVLNWYIGDETCDTAQKRDDYACQQNSDCNNSSTGYTCRCKPGYQGNPYLPHGCQDIDECANPNLNTCGNGRCHNTEGNHTCTCNSGYRNLDPKTCIRGTNNTALKISLGVSLGSFGLLLLIFWIFFGVKRRKARKMREKFSKQNGGLLVRQRLASYDGSVDEAALFTEKQIKIFTNNYAETLGEGGFGIVYKGTLSGNLPEDKKVVAVKRSKLNVANSVEFGNEVILLSQVKHRNVLILRGCCLETKTPILVYEYISQGTLYDHIHKVGGKEALPWDIRLKIAAGTAKALEYLHHSLAKPIIHRDVKSENILLDQNFEAKISDFGASKLMEEDENQVATAVQGTPGYLDPEYTELGILTKKSDVYSFGVVLAEILTSKFTLVRKKDEQEVRKLVDVFVLAVEEKRLNEILDPEIAKAGLGFPESVYKVAELAKRCLARTSNERPAMDKVAAKLGHILDEVRGKHPDEGEAYVKQSPKDTDRVLGSPDNCIVDVRDEGEDGDSVMTTTSATTSADYHQSMQNQTQMVKPYGSGR